MGYYDVVAGLEGDYTAVFACGVYGSCLNVARGSFNFNGSGLNSNVSGVAVFVARPCVDIACFYFSCLAGDGDVAAFGGQVCAGCKNVAVSSF